MYLTCKRLTLMCNWLINPIQCIYIYIYSVEHFRSMVPKKRTEERDVLFFGIPTCLTFSSSFTLRSCSSSTTSTAPSKTRTSSTPRRNIPELPFHHQHYSSTRLISVSLTCSVYVCLYRVGIPLHIKCFVKWRIKWCGTLTSSVILLPFFRPILTGRLFVYSTDIHTHTYSTKYSGSHV